MVVCPGASWLSPGESLGVVFGSSAEPKRITVSPHITSMKRLTLITTPPFPRTSVVFHLYGAILLGIMHFIGIIWE